MTRSLTSYHRCMAESHREPKKDIPNVVELRPYPQKEAFLKALEQYQHRYVTASFTLAGKDYGIYGPGEDVARHVRQLAIGSPVSVGTISGYDGTPMAKQLLGVAQRAAEFIDLTEKE